ncbi:MAG: hypothetical protein Kow0026_13610 [Oricola sp.]
MKRLVLLVPIVSACAALPVRADDAVARGAAVVEQWCRQCHLRGGDPPDPVMAPSFEEIVTRMGRDRGYFRKFLHEDHFPMTTFRLFEHEKQDVLEWLVALQKKQRAR